MGNLDGEEQPVVNGSATFSVAGMSEGKYKITATYTDDSTNGTNHYNTASTENMITITKNPFNVELDWGDVSAARTMYFGGVIQPSITITENGAAVENAGVTFRIGTGEIESNEIICTGVTNESGTYACPDSSAVTLSNTDNLLYDTSTLTTNLSYEIKYEDYGTVTGLITVTILQTDLIWTVNTIENVLPTGTFNISGNVSLNADSNIDKAYLENLEIEATINSSNMQNAKSLGTCSTSSTGSFSIITDMSTWDTSSQLKPDKYTITLTCRDTQTIPVFSTVTTDIKDVYVKDTYQIIVSNTLSDDATNTITCKVFDSNDSPVAYVPVDFYCYAKGNSTSILKQVSGTSAYTTNNKGIITFKYTPSVSVDSDLVFKWVINATDTYVSTTVLEDIVFKKSMYITFTSNPEEINELMQLTYGNSYTFRVRVTTSKMTGISGIPTTFKTYTGTGDELSGATTIGTATTDSDGYATLTYKVKDTDLPKGLHTIRVSAEPTTSTKDYYNRGETNSTGTEYTSSSGTTTINKDKYFYYVNTLSFKNGSLTVDENADGVTGANTKLAQQVYKNGTTTGIAKVPVELKVFNSNGDKILDQDLTTNSEGKVQYVAEIPYGKTDSEGNPVWTKDCTIRWNVVSQYHDGLSSTFAYDAHKSLSEEYNMIVRHYCTIKIAPHEFHPDKDIAEPITLFDAYDSIGNSVEKIRVWINSANYLDSTGSTGNQICVTKTGANAQYITTEDGSYCGDLTTFPTNSGLKLSKADSLYYIFAYTTDTTYIINTGGSNLSGEIADYTLDTDNDTHEYRYFSDVTTDSSGAKTYSGLKGSLFISHDVAIKYEPIIEISWRQHDSSTWTAISSTDYMPGEGDTVDFKVNVKYNCAGTLNYWDITQYPWKSKLKFDGKILSNTYDQTEAVLGQGGTTTGTKASSYYSNISIDAHTYYEVFVNFGYTIKENDSWQTYTWLDHQAVYVKRHLALLLDSTTMNQDDNTVDMYPEGKLSLNATLSNPYVKSGVYKNLSVMFNMAKSTGSYDYDLKNNNGSYYVVTSNSKGRVTLNYDNSTSNANRITASKGMQVGNKFYLFVKPSDTSIQKYYDWDYDQEMATSGYPIQVNILSATANYTLVDKTDSVQYVSFTENSDGTYSYKLTFKAYAETVSGVALTGLKLYVVGVDDSSKKATLTSTGSGNYSGTLTFTKSTNKVTDLPSTFNYKIYGDQQSVSGQVYNAISCKPGTVNVSKGTIVFSNGTSKNGETCTHESSNGENCHHMTVATKMHLNPTVSYAETGEYVVDAEKSVWLRDLVYGHRYGADDSESTAYSTDSDGSVDIIHDMSSGWFSRKYKYEFRNTDYGEDVDSQEITVYRKHNLTARCKGISISYKNTAYHPLNVRYYDYGGNANWGYGTRRSLKGTKIEANGTSDTSKFGKDDAGDFSTYNIADGSLYMELWAEQLTGDYVGYKYRLKLPVVSTTNSTNNIAYVGQNLERQRKWSNWLNFWVKSDHTSDEYTQDSELEYCTNGYNSKKGMLPKGTYSVYLKPKRWSDAIGHDYDMTKRVVVYDEKKLGTGNKTVITLK